MKVTQRIGTKLIIIITIISFLSLGLITFFVALFVGSDVEKTARTNLRIVNNMSSLATEDSLLSIKSGCMLMLKSISSYGDENSAQAANLAGLYFSQNPDMVAVLKRGETEDFFSGHMINSSFFSSNALSEAMLNEFVEAHFKILNRALIGETIIINASPFFNGIPLLAMSFPLQGFESVMVLFASGAITDSFDTGTISTSVINYFGDVLIHPDQELINAGANITQNPFVQESIAIPTATFEKRFRYESGSFFGVSQKLSNANIIVISLMDTDVIFESINLTTKRNIYFSLGIWFLAVLVFWFFSKTISSPIEKLKAAMERISGGNYRLNLKSENRDETGILTKSIQGMSNVLQNFEAFTNKRLAHLAMEGRLKTSGVPRNTTIFFSDIRSFTAISEKLSPAEVVEFLNDYMERMVACVFLTGGAIDKFIGDAVMAHWGAVESAGSAQADALRGVGTALMMRASLRCFNKGRGGAKKPVIDIGCGINTGSVAAGQIGSDERIVFTVIGKAVSLADRTETFNKQLCTDILITEHTYKLVADHIIAEEMCAITENGEKVKIFAVVNMKAGVEADRLFEYLKKVPKNDMKICKKCIGPGGPKNIHALRMLLGLPEPDLRNINFDDEEKKYNAAS